MCTPINVYEVQFIRLELMFDSIINIYNWTTPWSCHTFRPRKFSLFPLRQSSYDLMCCCHHPSQCTAVQFSLSRVRILDYLETIQMGISQILLKPNSEQLCATVHVQIQVQVQVQLYKCTDSIFIQTKNIFSPLDCLEPIPMKISQILWNNICSWILKNLISIKVRLKISKCKKSCNNRSQG